MVRLDGADVAALIEVLEHGRDGHPRWIVTTVDRRRSLPPTVDAITNAAITRGFVTVAVDAYLRARLVDPHQFDHRTLLLVDEQNEPGSAHNALLHACVQSPRPHVLMTIRAGTDVSSAPAVFREARAAYSADVEVQSPHATELIARARRAPEFVARGRHAAAERLLRDVSAALARRGVQGQAARVGLDLGRLLLDRGRVNRALESFAQAVSWAQAARRDTTAIEGRLWQATARIQSGAFVQAEGICRGVLERASIGAELSVWARALLVEALVWQRRSAEVDEVPLAGAEALDPVVSAQIHHIRIRWMLTRQLLFEAGSAVAALRELASSTGNRVVRAIAHHADLEVVAETGDLQRVTDVFDSAIAAARSARLPLRVAWCRLVLIDAARRAGKTVGVARHLASLTRLSRTAPPLLQGEIDRRVSTQSVAAFSRAPASRVLHGSLPAALLRVAHEEDEDISAIKHVLTRIAGELEVSRIDVHSNAAGPATLLCSIGEGLQTGLVARVLEAGFAIGPERQNGGWEVALPVRFASRTLGAVSARWPIDRRVPAAAGELLELAAVIVGPRVDGIQAAAREQVKSSGAVPELLGVSDAIENVRRALVRAAAAPFNVLIEGESGVGKELAARAVHHLSLRRERRFRDLNCAALPEELLESELFGHARGAFSGAVTDRAGLFEDADGGTLFLDEVADLSPRAQAKLLRVIQQQEVRRVGESFSRKIDVRLIAAANRDLRAEAAGGRFRSDLLYRLDVVRIQIPPLRDRLADIPVLAEHCWNAATHRTGSKARLSPATLNELSRYHWPGNVREMQNVIASLAVSAPARGWVRPSALAAIIGAATVPASGRLADARTQFERRFVEVALARSAGNRARAARSLGVSRQGLVKILMRLGLDRSSREGESC